MQAVIDLLPYSDRWWQPGLTSPESGILGVASFERSKPIVFTVRLLFTTHFDSEALTVKEMSPLSLVTVPRNCRHEVSIVEPSRNAEPTNNRGAV